MEQHMQTIRTPDRQVWEGRATVYRAALQTPSTERVPPHQDRTPRAFRPSSSRVCDVLAGIGFNVHAATLSLNVLDPEEVQQEPQQPEPQQGAIFHNITCGAPSDHARGFGNIFPKSNPKESNHSNNGQLGAAPPSVGHVTGGLRRLEAKRQELGALVSNLQTTLTMFIANYFGEQRQVSRKSVTHVPPRHPELAALRWQLFEALQSLHHVTWVCAMRRAACFSQALGIALSSYLSSLSEHDMDISFRLRDS
jgi:hypothetical protein